MIINQIMYTVTHLATDFFPGATTMLVSYPFDALDNSTTVHIMRINADSKYVSKMLFFLM